MVVIPSVAEFIVAKLTKLFRKMICYGDKSELETFVERQLMAMTPDEVRCFKG